MTKKVEIPDELYEKAERYISSEGGFSSVDELVTYLLEEFLGEEEGALTPEEEEKIKEKLKSLGYI